MFRTFLISIIGFSLAQISCSSRTRVTGFKAPVETVSNLAEPSPRAMHTAIWVGDGMLVWGGLLDQTKKIELSGGSIFYPETQKWERIPLIQREPISRYHHSGIRAEDEFIVWGGTDGGLGEPTDSGFRYSLTDKEWRDVSSIDSPTARSGHTANWDGKHMIIWGGWNGQQFLADGKYYDPKEDKWHPMPPNDILAGRAYHTSLIAGDKLLIWGGLNETGVLDTGAVFDMKTKAWSPIVTEGAPQSRMGHSAVWTGDSMIIWGGSDNIDRYFRNGYSYDPESKTWTRLSKKQSPPARESHSSVWTGKEMIIWGGSRRNINFRYGAAYNPESDSWRPIRTQQRNFGRKHHSAVWTGEKMIIWGGKNGEKFIEAGENYSLTVD